MSDGVPVSLEQFQVKCKRKGSLQNCVQSSSAAMTTAANYDDMFGEHMENYSVETTALHRKLQSKIEALSILRKELEKFRTERDQFKLMAETLQLRYAAMRRNSMSDFAAFSSDVSGDVAIGGCNSSVAKIIHDTRERNIKLTTEVETLKQKLSEVQGDIEVLRIHKTSSGENTKDFGPKINVSKEESLLDGCSKEMLMQWKQERSNFICHLEQLKQKNAQLAFDLKAIIDEKEELINERDAYKCKTHRLNHELLACLRAKETHPKFLDIDSIILENKYLNERLRNIESEVELTKQSLSKYKTMLEAKRKKGIMKLGAQSPINVEDSILSHKQVKNLLDNGIDLPTKTETIHDLKTLCLTLLDNINDKNLALNHQKKANKILATKIAELEQRMITLAGIETPNEDEGFSASEYLLRGYCPYMVDTTSHSGNEKNKIPNVSPGVPSLATTVPSTTSCGESRVTEHSGTMFSDNEDSMKIPEANQSDDAISSLSTESGRSILSSEYDLTHDHLGSKNFNDFTDAAFYAHKSASTTSGSAGWKTTRERVDDLKDLPPELAALVQKALHELDLRDFDEVVDELCEDVVVETNETMTSNLGNSDELLEEELNSEDGAIGGCSNLIEAN